MQPRESSTLNINSNVVLKIITNSALCTLRPLVIKRSDAVPLRESHLLYFPWDVSSLVVWLCASTLDGILSLADYTHDVRLLHPCLKYS
jgi:hypothetical protein